MFKWEENVIILYLLVHPNLAVRHTPQQPHTPTHAQTNTDVSLCDLLIFILFVLDCKINLVMFYSRSTDALLKSKVLLCFYSRYTEFIWNINDLCIETGSLQQPWIQYRIR